MYHAYTTKVVGTYYILKEVMERTSYTLLHVFVMNRVCIIMVERAYDCSQIRYSRSISVRIY